MVCVLSLAKTTSGPSATIDSLQRGCHQARTHLALDKDAPDIRPIQLPEAGRILQIAEVGGLHHRYVRRAA